MSAESNDAIQEMENCALIAKRYIEWHRESEQIKKPEDLFNDEKRRIEICVSEARASLVRTLSISRIPECQYDEKLEEFAKWVGKREVLLNAGCRCQFKSFEKMHANRVAEHVKKFRALEKYKSRRIGPQSDTDESDDDSNLTRQEPRTDSAIDSSRPSSAENSTRIQSNTSVTMSLSPDARPEECDGENVHVNATQGLVLREEPSTTPDMPGTTTPHSGNQNKRRLANPEPSSETEQPKRPRLDDSRTTPRGGASDGEIEITQSQSRLTIEFDELYQNGEAEYKHYIVQWPKVGGKWYILRCDKHGLHFGASPLHAAGQHLAGRSHNNMQKTPDVAIKELGIEVLNCDEEKQTLNNSLFERLVDSGEYLPLNNKTAANWHRPPPSQARGPSRQPRGSDEWVTNARPGEIYRVLWPKLNQFLAVVILPRDCFGDPTFDEIGLPGGSLEDTCLLENIPACYRVCPTTGKIIGWAEGYEDGGELTTDREFPVLCFDRLPYLRKTSVTWRSAKDLRTFDLNNRSDWKTWIDNYKYLEQFLARRKPPVEEGVEGDAGTVTVTVTAVSTSGTQQPAVNSVTAGASGGNSGSPGRPAPLNHFQSSSIALESQRGHPGGTTIQAQATSQESPEAREGTTIEAPIELDLQSPNGEAQQELHGRPEHTRQTAQEADIGPQQRAETARRSGSREQSAADILREIQSAECAGVPQNFPLDVSPPERQVDANPLSPLQPRYASVNHIRNRRSEAGKNSREIRTGVPTSEPRFMPISESQGPRHLNPTGPSGTPSTPPYPSTTGAHQLFTPETPHGPPGATDAQRREQREAPQQTCQSSSDVRPQISRPSAHAHSGQAQPSNESRPSTTTPGPAQNLTNGPQLHFPPEIIVPAAQVSDTTFVQGNISTNDAPLRAPEAVMMAPQYSDLGDSFDPEGDLWGY